MYNGIMNLMNTLEMRYRKNINDNIINNTENEYNITLAVDPITMMMSGLGGVAVGGVLHYENGDMINVILVDGTYLHMSETGKQFVIGHELGHLVCQIEKFRRKDNSRTLHDECEADEYAMKQIGLIKSISGLLELRRIVKFNTDDIDAIKELNKRIINLIIKSVVGC